MLKGATILLVPVLLPTRMDNIQSEETSADWADRLQLFDAGEFDALERSKIRAQQNTVLEQEPGRGTGRDEEQRTTIPPVNLLDQRRIEMEQHSVAERTLDPSPLTLRIRQRLRDNDSTMGGPSETTCALLVRQVSPSLLSKLHTQPNSPCAVLVAYFDACPYSRATEDGLVSLAKRMHRRNLSIAALADNTKRDFCIMMYDIRAKGNRTFAIERLHASPVPKLYTVVPQSRAIVPWTGEALGEVRPSATSNEWTRTLPEDELFDALRHM